MIINVFLTKYRIYLAIIMSLLDKEMLNARRDALSIARRITIRAFHIAHCYLCAIGVIF